MRAVPALLLFALVFASVPARAARPLLDRHQWDAYFSLFARDTSVPWKTASVRLDTYSGAPLELAAYDVDPADVIVAGQNRTPRALDVAHRKPVVRWRFSPPPGYRFETSDVAVPLGNREGFFVVEARRGEAVQQVWLNRTHLGLLTKASPEGLLVWCVDLHSGRALRGVSVSFLVGLQLIVKRTDADGLIVWRDSKRPSFALAEQGAGRAFVSILPQAPRPSAIVGLRVESAAARAGERVRFVGFARTRGAQSYERASGDARVTLAGRGKTFASTIVRLDSSGAFAGELTIPAKLDAGDYAVLGSAAGAVGGTSVHVDAAGDVTLAIDAVCPCDPDRDLPISVLAQRGEAPASDVPVRVQIVRTPHVVPPGAPDDALRWGTTVVYDKTVRTGADGVARVTIATPSDGLDSTYGISATARGASASSRAVVPNAKLSLAIEPEAISADVGSPIALNVRGFDPTDGSPAGGVAVKLRLSHGASAQTQSVSLDARGFAHVVFRRPNLGSNLVLAEATVDGRKALDAAAILVEPSALSGHTASAQAAVTVALDKTRYRPRANIEVRANAPGAVGDALIALEGARTYVVRRVPVAGERAQTTLDLGDPQGAVRVTAAFVRDGAIALGSAAVSVDGPGHARLTDLALERLTYAAGEMLHGTVHDGGMLANGTMAVRIADGRESGPALFEDAPDLLGTGSTTSQAPASDDPEWHAYVAPARSKASDIFAAERPRKVPTEAPSIGVAAPRTLLWRILRDAGDSFAVPAPAQRGHYVVSILRISPDGDVGAASASFNVR